MKPTITGLDRARVEDEIHTQEQHTSAEIVATVATQSDDYLHVPLHIAAGLALCVPLALPFVFRLIAMQHWSWDGVLLPSYFWIFAIQLLVFVFTALVLSLEPLRAAVTPRSLKLKYARRLASEQFLASRMHTTAGRTGVFIFASLLEHHVEIIADVEAAKHISDHEWQAIVDDMIPLLRRGDLTSAFVHGVTRCGPLLAKAFPPGRHNRNELPDRMVVIDQGG